MSSVTERKGAPTVVGWLLKAERPMLRAGSAPPEDVKRNDEVRHCPRLGLLDNSSGRHALI